MDKVFICSLDKLNSEKTITKWIEEWKDEIILFKDKLSGRIKIFSSICPHFGGEIYLDKTNNLRCKWHDWKFSSETGKCLTYPIRGKLNPYDFEVKPQSLKTYEVIELEKGDIYAIKK